MEIQKIGEWVNQYAIVVLAIVILIAIWIKARKKLNRYLNRT